MPESQDQNLALTVLCVPCLQDLALNVLCVPCLQNLVLTVMCVQCLHLIRGDVLGLGGVPAALLLLAAHLVVEQPRLPLARFAPLYTNSSLSAISHPSTQ